MTPRLLGAPLGVYIHIPFCQHICPYCDFTTYAGQEPLIPRYVDALVTAIRRAGEQLDHRAVETVFFGGGTPSLIDPDDIARIIGACSASFTLDSNAEITLEANPNSSDQTRFAGYRAAGVNRLSIGVQTANRRGLRTLGRNHEAGDARTALESARAAGFENVSLDLIFGWPGQTREIWRSDLEAVFDWGGGPDHLSLYSLIVEPGTPMSDAVARGILHPVDDDLSADLYEDAIAFLADRGWMHYEVANWAKAPGLQSRHNKIYWQNGEYLAIGAGAHGRLGDRRLLNHLHPRGYIDAIERGEDGVGNIEQLTPEMERGETMMIGLRLLLDGVDAIQFAERHGALLDSVFGDELQSLIEIGMITREGDRIRLTHRGLMVANDVAELFITLP